MTLGALYDRLKELEQAEIEVSLAQTAIEFGGNVNTMNAKRQHLQFCEETVKALRAEELEL